MSGDFRAGEFWEQRLERAFSLQGTGHTLFSPSYNVWLYRHKARCLRRALIGAPEGRALDVGSGTGWVVDQLMTAGRSVTGCDITETAVRELSARLPAASFHHLALGTDPLPGSQYAVATALDVTYHVVDDELWRTGVADIARVLRVGGWLVVTDAFGDADERPAEHVRFRSWATWLDAAADLGLRPVKRFAYYRWLSRDRNDGAFARLPGRARGPLEFALERIAPLPAHMRCAVFERAPYAAGHSARTEPLA